MTITLGQYIEIMSILKRMDLVDFEYEGAVFSKTGNQIYTEYPELTCKLLSIVTDKTPKDIAEMPATQIVGMLELVIAQISIPEPTVCPVSFELDEVEYLPVSDYDDIDSSGELVKVVFGEMPFGDTLEAMRLSELAQGNLKMLPYVLANIYREQGEQSTVTDRAVKFLELDFSDAYAAYFFFFNSESGFMRSLSSQLKETIEVLNIKERQRRQEKNKWQNLDITEHSGRQAKQSRLTNWLRKNPLTKSLRTLLIRN